MKIRIQMLFTIEWIKTFKSMGIGIISMKTIIIILTALEIGLESGLIWVIKTL